MPSRSFGLHPQQLAGLRAPGAPAPQPSAPPNPVPIPEFGGQAPTTRPGPIAPPSFPFDPSLPPNLSQPFLDPGVLGGLRGGAPNLAPGMFPGGQAPGVFGQPAPFNPFLAQALMSRLGGMGQGPAPALMPRGPLGAFGLTGPGERPKTKKNPYQ